MTIVVNQILAPTTSAPPAKVANAVAPVAPTTKKVRSAPAAKIVAPNTKRKNNRCGQEARND